MDRGNGIEVDAAGNAYVTGLASSTVFPGTIGSPIQPANGGSFDAFVTKFNATGSALDTYTRREGKAIGSGRP
ncbi:MAG: hypothetical protein O7A06_17445 [Acidobacteria bacterium]|nr:hypothetical protein [Acidobacteriota bacterium]MCZ6751153.1 hypothetical protein [Acidobacteriota bacterium]